jgi:alpha-beta hydrolase superfamily lysophospholipase
LEPNALVIFFATLLCQLIPTWPIAPVTDITHLVFRNPSKVDEVKADKKRYQGGFRLQTALSLRQASIDIQAHAAREMEVPFLILQGTSDIVTSVPAVKEFFKNSIVKDKTLVFFEHAFHSLFWETVDTRANVLQEIIDWIDKRLTREDRVGVLESVEYKSGNGVVREYPLGSGKFASALSMEAEEDYFDS